MEPIVSPWLIYGIETLDKVNFAMLMGAIVSGAILIVMTPHMFFNYLPNESLDHMGKLLYRIATIFILFVITCVIIPSRETAYKTLMASYVTPNNIHTVGREANEAVSVLLDNITDHMKELNDNK